MVVYCDEQICWPLVAGVSHTNSIPWIRSTGPVHKKFTTTFDVIQSGTLELQPRSNVDLSKIAVLGGNLFPRFCKIFPDSCT